jgi:hypothetical protein
MTTRVKASMRNHRSVRKAAAEEEGAGDQE